MAEPALSEFEQGEVVRITRGGELICIGEFRSCNGERITIKTFDLDLTEKLESIEIRGLHIECWPELSGMEGVAFISLMDERSDWLEESCLEKFTQQQLERIFLRGDARIRSDPRLLSRIRPERLIELLPKQEDREVVETVIKSITNVDLLRSLLKTSNSWDCEAATTLVEARIEELAPSRSDPTPKTVRRDVVDPLPAKPWYQFW